ncbi:RNI-like superfamily protein [Rhynchospora pubera]|uniref:RNI-like superfamily protein n=1 Tax=Rhynchospora pubera TaxID=906938 RepID=A0AAV8HJ62_9POAL|nr:RNI-like superfamily protein [Rhynchospora pubera]
MERGEVEGEPPAGDRNWSELPRDVLMLIFLKVGLLEVLQAAGSVCRSWRKVAKEEPELWRRIDLTDHPYGFEAFVLQDPTKLAIDRSGGLLEEFSVDYFGDDDLLRYLCDRTSVLKRLCLISCYQVSEEAIAETAKRQPLLEEIQITFGSFSEKVTEIVGKECPQLKSFKFNTKWYNMPHTDPHDEDEISDEEEISDDEEKTSDDDEALGIAKTMHQLQHLQLIGNRMTNEGLKAILDGCPHLETLDIRRCYNVNMDADIRARCARLKTIRLPGDSVDDYEFEADADQDDSCDVEESYDDEDEDEDGIPCFYDDDYDRILAVYNEHFGDMDDDDIREYMFYDEDGNYIF